MRVLYRSSAFLLIFLFVPILADSVQAQAICCDLAGDANHDMTVNIGDAVYLWKMFKGGPLPPCLQEGDPNADGYMNVADVYFLVSKVYDEGPPPACGPETPPGPIPSSDAVHLYWDITKASSGTVVDTLIAGQLYALRLSIENSIILKGMGFGYRVFSADGASIHWQISPSNPYQVNYIVVPGSRMDPPAVVWDMQFLFGPFDMDDNLPDRFVFGAVPIYNGLAPGAKETMIELFFTPDSVPSDVRRLCIDSSAGVFGNGSDFVISDQFGQGSCPVFEWPAGGKCWSVRNPVGFAGDANADGSTNVGDAVYLINYIFKSGPAPSPLKNGDVNCDDAINVGDAVYLINYIFKGGPGPCPL